MSADQPPPTTSPASRLVGGLARFGWVYDERVEKGLATYGTSLKTWNGRDAIKDAQEEAVDLWRYLEQARLERLDMIAAGEALASAAEDLVRHDDDARAHVLECARVAAVATEIAAWRALVDGAEGGADG